MALLAIKVVSTRSSLSKYWHCDFFEQMSMHGMVGMEKKLESGDEKEESEWSSLSSLVHIRISNEFFLMLNMHSVPRHIIKKSICLNSTHTFRHF